MISPSPFITSVVPDETFDPQRHVAFGDVFLECSMSGIEDEIEAITRGAGLPDRADHGWISLVGEGGLQEAELWGAELKPGQGLCGMRLEDLSDEPLDLYAGTEQLWVGLPRTSVQAALTKLCAKTEAGDIAVTDETGHVARIAVMGPDSRTLLEALGVGNDQLLQAGDHTEIEIIQEPVRVCRSDFAGPHGYDFIIPSGPFNMILAVICSWGVRLEMNLLPVGWDAVQETAAAAGAGCHNQRRMPAKD